MLNTEANTEIQRNTQLTSVVMDFIAIVRRLHHEAKQAHFTFANWAPLAELTAVDDFELVSHNREVLGWNEFTQHLTQLVLSVTWETTIHRIHQWQNIVFLEHEEHYAFDDKVDGVRSLSVFEFNQAGKIQRIAGYLQQKPSLGL